MAMAASTANVATIVGQRCCAAFDVGEGEPRTRSCDRRDKAPSATSQPSRGTRVIVARPAAEVHNDERPRSPRPGCDARRAAPR